MDVELLRDEAVANDYENVLLVYRAAADLNVNSLKGSDLPLFLLMINKAAEHAKKDVRTYFRYVWNPLPYFDEDPSEILKSAGYLAETHREYFLTTKGGSETVRIKEKHPETYGFIKAELKHLMKLDEETLKHFFWLMCV